MKASTVDATAKAGPNRIDKVVAERIASISRELRGGERVILADSASELVDMVKLRGGNPDKLVLKYKTPSLEFAKNWFGSTPPMPNFMRAMWHFSLSTTSLSCFR
jgi:hypothetical protein